MTGPKGNGEFCFPRIEGKIEIQGKKFTVPQGTSHKVICYIAKHNNSKF